VKIFLLCVCLCLLNLSGAFADDTGPDYSKGPLYGKNLFIPLLLHYNFPSLSAKSGQQFDLRYHLSAYYVQDVYYIIYEWPEERIYDKDNVIRDYESNVIELGLSYNYLDRLQFGFDMRLYSYYGGFMDPVIEGFHSLFGFPNAGRDFYLQNQLHVDIPNDNGISIYLDDPATSFGDIDLWGKWTFFEDRKMSLAAMGALKLPTGKLKYLSGSGSVDAAAALLLDYRAAKYFTFFAQSGLVLPFNGKSYTMFNGLIGMELHPWEFLSFNLQSNIKTSPISDYTFDYPRIPSPANNFRKYVPQINLLVGLVFQHKDLKLQFYFEEDAFIVCQGTDITFNIMLSHGINLKNKFTKDQ